MLTKLKVITIKKLANCLERRMKPHPPTEGFKALEGLVGVFEKEKNPEYQYITEGIQIKFEQLKHPIIAKYVTLDRVSMLFDHSIENSRVSVYDDDFLDQVYIFSHDKDYRYKVQSGFANIRSSILRSEIITNNKVNWVDTWIRWVLFYDQVYPIIDWYDVKRWVSWGFFVGFMILAITQSYLVMGPIGVARVGIGSLCGWFMGAFFRNDEIGDLAVGLILAMLFISVII